MIHSGRYFTLPKPQASPNSFFIFFFIIFLTFLPFFFPFSLMVFCTCLSKYKAPSSASPKAAAVFSSQPLFQDLFSFSWLTAGLFQESLAYSQGTLIICLVRFLVADIICKTPTFHDSFFWTFLLHRYLAARYNSPSLKYNFRLPHHKSGCVRV